MCGPPPEKATGMSRPIAADGTINISAPAALAPGAAALQSPTASTSVKSPHMNRRITPTSRHFGLVGVGLQSGPRRKVVNHTDAVVRVGNVPATAGGGDP
ncbi:MAG: hypothetical protein NVSMB60_11610 [Mycobacterium sp.]